MNTKKLLLLFLSTTLLNIYGAASGYDPSYDSDEFIDPELSEIMTGVKTDIDDSIRAASGAFFSLSVSEDGPKDFWAKPKNDGRISGGTTALERQEKNEKRKALQKRVNDARKQREPQQVEAEPRSASAPIIRKRSTEEEEEKAKTKRANSTSFTPSLQSYTEEMDTE